LSEFVKKSWHILEPTTELKWGWAIEAVCDHLQAVTEGEFNRLLITIPPGFSKSLLTSVFWPAWEWGPAKKPQNRFVSTSHSKELATRDSTKCRTLIESSWFQSRWPIKLKDDQNAKTNFANEFEGFREAAAFTKMTGKRGDRVILDDPISAYDANSETEIRNAEIAFLETLPSRVNNEQSAIVVIMQRLSQRDVAGIILDKKLPYIHLNLPMRFEPERKCITPIFEDPRTEDGQLLFPEFFSEERVSKLEETLGSFAIAGQLQQSPVPRGGGLFSREWFKPLDAIPNNIHWVRGWDLAATTNATSAYTVGVKLGKTPDGKIVVGHVVRGRWTPDGVYKIVNEMAEFDGVSTRISIPTDPGAAGISVKRQFALNLSNFDVRFSPETGDKVTRAMPLSAQAEAGNVYYLKGDWNSAFLDEISMFPNGKWLDQVDASSRAYSELMKLEQFTTNVSYFGPKVYS
jgi:predicted phage terminase large subunit-like protein